MTTRRVPIIGIVGGIGSGKSSLAAAFEELGCVRLDADKTGHEMLARADVFCELVTEFGREILGPGDRVDRSLLAAVAFASEEATRRLNEIVGGALWPEFRRRVLEAADHAGQDVQAVVLDAALLYESQTDQICDGVVFVEAPDEVRRERIAESRGWDWEEVLRRQERQFALSRKRGMADEVCTNTAGIDHLRDQARKLLTIFRERFFSP